MMCRRNLIAWLLVLVMLVGMVPVQALAAETATPRIDAQQIVLGEDLTMRFLATISDSNAVMNISVAGEEVGSYPVADMTPNSDGYYEFATELAAAQMTDVVNLELTSGEAVLLSKDYSVQQYADALLAGDYSDEIKTMVRQMLNYGAAAQTYFAYNTENPVSLDAAVETVAIPAEAETEMVAEGIVEGISFYGASLLFRSKIAVRFYFEAPNGVESYTFTANGETCEAQAVGEMYCVEIPSVSPADYSNVIELTVADENSNSIQVSYSPMHYLINMNNKETSSDSLKVLLQAMYNYHLAAVDYTDGDSSVEYPYSPAFTAKYDNSYYIGNCTVSLGSLFAANEGVAENAVIDVAVEGPVTYNAASGVTDWANWTVTFDGTGAAKITVNGTELQLTVENTSLSTPYHHVTPEFTANYDNSYYIGNCTVALSTLFSCSEGIGEDAVVDVEVSGAAAYEPANSAMDWANGKVTFSGTGEATVTVNGVSLTLTVENTSLSEPYHHVKPTFTANYGAGYYIGNCTVSLSTLFSCSEGIGENAVIDVEVSGAAAYEPADSVMEWANGTVTFSGTGEATVTVNGISLTLTVENTSLSTPYQHVSPAFTANYGAGYYIGNCTVSLSTLFSCSEGIGENAVIDVEVSGAAAYEPATSAMEWANSKVTFSGTGEATVTVNGISLTLTVENTSLNTPYQHVYPEFTANYDNSYYIGNCTVSLVSLFSTSEGVGENAVIDVAVEGPVTYTAASSVTDWANGSLKFSGTGVAKITVNGVSLTLTVENTSLSEPYHHDTPAFTVKFENTDDYLYRVGNGNAVALGTLFASDEVTETSDITVNVESLDSNTDVAGTYTAASSVTGWANGTLKFTGTGPVKVTINGTELMLEVIDAYNVTTYTELQNRNSVLLSDIEMSEGGSFYLSGYTLYGNGFTLDMKNGTYAVGGNVSSNYVFGLNNANLDNVKIVGAVYTQYGATVQSEYNRAAVLSTGNNTITNCYIANCASAVRVKDGNLEIINSTIKGGNFANIDIRGGHVVLDNVTTINQVNGNDTAEDGTIVVGLGIVVYYEQVLATTTVEIKNGITQYNHLSESQANTYITDSTAKQLVSKMYDTDYANVQYSDGSETWINTGILSMTAEVRDDNITDVDGYVDASPEMNNVTGYLHTKVPDATSIAAVAPAYETAGQGAIAPGYSFDYTTKNYAAKADGSNDYCYQESGTVYISMDAGDTFNWDTSILTATKNGQTLSYTVSMNGTDYTGKSIAFNTAGAYEVVYTYTDSNNYTVDDSGNITTYAKTYEKTVHISVAVIEASAKKAEFTMGSSNAATEKITVDNVTYISATGVTADNTTWTYMTVGGEKIYYPIIAAKLTSTKGASTYAYFPVFENAVTITDYADGGTGAAVTYNASTTTLPSGLTAVKGIYKAAADVTSWTNLNNSHLTQSGASQIFKWATSSDAPSDPTTYNNVLCYKSTQVSANRAAYITLVQYSYTDATNTTYYYYVGYTLEAFTKSSTCVTPDTLVTLADGTQKQIQYVTYDDELLVWNFYTGAYDVAPASIVMNHGYDEHIVTTLKFDDGTQINTINGHGFFDVAQNKYVILNENNAKDYIGHEFVKVDADGYTTVKLADYTVKTEHTESWSVLTSQHYNCIMENMWTLTPAEVEGSPDYLMPYEIGEDMKYDEAKMLADIEAYGQYTYDDFAAYCTYEQYVAFGFENFKVSVGKGFITWEDIEYLLSIHVG